MPQFTGAVNQKIRGGRVGPTRGSAGDSRGPELLQHRRQLLGQGAVAGLSAQVLPDQIVAHADRRAMVLPQQHAGDGGPDEPCRPG